VTTTPNQIAFIEETTMTEATDRIIDSLRSGHDHLAAVVQRLTAADLTRLPIIERDLAQSDPERFLSVPVRSSQWFAAQLRVSAPSHLAEARRRRGRPR